MRNGGHALCNGCYVELEGVKVVEGLDGHFVVLVSCLVRHPC